MITLQNISKSYGIRELFSQVTFSVNPGERIGLIGRNGYGKTTLFRIIVGDEQADSGEVEISKGYTIGYLQQHTACTHDTLFAEASAALSDEEAGEDWKVKKILQGLGFVESDFVRAPQEFSGGYQMRLALAKVLLSEPHALLLDEPTNYLDIVTIRWLEAFLRAWPHELIIISHDRDFIDAVSTHIIGIHRGRCRKFSGKTAAYYRQIALEEEVYERERQNTEKKRKQMEQFINKFRAKARQASLAQSRRKAIEKMDIHDELATIETLSFRFNYDAIPAKKNLLDARDITFSYSGAAPYLFHALSLCVSNGDKICVVGKNGKGKTTFLKVMLNVLHTVTGEIKTHPRLSVGYYEQSNTSLLNPELTIEQELTYAATDLTRSQVRSVCGALMFSGDDVFKKIEVISGGEKCRVLIGKLLLSPANVLVLDEPTHHLDIESCNALMDAVNAFEGAVIIVTHDEHFLRACATKLVVFDDDRQFVFPGTYDEFLEQYGWHDDDKNHTRCDGTPGVKKISRKERAERVQERARRIRPVQQEIDRLEKHIEKSETEHTRVNQELVAAAENTDGPRIAELSKKLSDLDTDIAAAYESLQTHYDELEQVKEEFGE